VIFFEKGWHFERFYDLLADSGLFAVLKLLHQCEENDVLVMDFFLVIELASHRYSHVFEFRSQEAIGDMDDERRVSI
jgi:hypothetical protein